MNTEFWQGKIWKSSILGRQGDEKITLRRSDEIWDMIRKDVSLMDWSQNRNQSDSRVLYQRVQHKLWLCYWFHTLLTKP